MKYLLSAIAGIVVLFLGMVALFIVANPAGFHLWQAQASHALGEAVYELWVGFKIFLGICLFFGIIWASLKLHKEWTHRNVRPIHPTKYGAAQAVVINDTMHKLQGMEIEQLVEMMQKTQKLLSPRTTVKEVEGTVEPATQPQLPAPRLPEMVRYEDVRHYVPQGHVLLGVSEHGVETCDFEKLMTCWIVGGSSTGKSNTVALKIDEAMRLGRNLKLLVIDPHAKKSDSLYNKIKPYEYAFLRPVAQYEDDILVVLQWFLAEFKHRLDTGNCSYDLLLVVDEVSNVVESENDEIGKLLKKIARICGQESRGFGMFGWFISQKAAGLAWLRNVVITVIAHKMNMMSERKLACNEDMAIARDMDTWPRGRVVVYGLGFEEVRVLQKPIFTVPQRAESVSRMEDLFPKPKTWETPAETHGNRDTEPTRIVDAETWKQSPPSSSVERENVPETAGNGIGNEVRETIRRGKMRGMADRELAAIVGLSGRKYGVYRQICQELGFVQVVEQEA